MQLFCAPPPRPLGKGMSPRPLSQRHPPPSRVTPAAIGIPPPPPRTHTKHGALASREPARSGSVFSQLPATSVGHPQHQFACAPLSPRQGKQTPSPFSRTPALVTPAAMGITTYTPTPNQTSYLAQQLACTLGFVVFKLQFECCQPHILTVRVGCKRLSKNGTGTRHITCTSATAHMHNNGDRVTSTACVAHSHTAVSMGAPQSPQCPVYLTAFNLAAGIMQGLNLYKIFNV